MLRKKAMKKRPAEEKAVKFYGQQLQHDLTRSQPVTDRQS